MHIIQSINVDFVYFDFFPDLKGLQNINFIVLLLEHDLVSPVPELHGTVIAGCVEMSLHDLISPDNSETLFLMKTKTNH